MNGTNYEVPQCGAFSIPLKLIIITNYADCTRSVILIDLMFEFLGEKYGCEDRSGGGGECAESVNLIKSIESRVSAFRSRADRIKEYFCCTRRNPGKELTSSSMQKRLLLPWDESPFIVD